MCLLFHSGQPQQQPHCHGQGTCLETLGVPSHASLLRGTDYTQRWQQLFHDCPKMVFEEVNELCSAKSYFRFGDGLFRMGQPFLHPFSVDGEEVACLFSSTTCDCPVCKCPHDKLDSTTEFYPMRLTEELCAAVAKAQEELLDKNLKPLPGNKKKVRTQLC